MVILSYFKQYWSASLCNAAAAGGVERMVVNLSDTIIFVQLAVVVKDGESYWKDRCKTRNFFYLGAV